MPTQTEAGKAFEYALFEQAAGILASTHQIHLEKDQAFQTAKNCFASFSSQEQSRYSQAASSAVRHIIELEPRLIHPNSEKDILTLKIVPDAQGISGDVRDVLFIRSTQNWEIGISAKNNHKAVKHSRLSSTINFGQDWLGFSCSEPYFKTIIPIFEELVRLKKNGELWRNVKQKDARFYVPVLEAFRQELLALDQQNPQTVPARLLGYLIGVRDFYKVIKGRNKSEIYGFNLHGTLNQPAKQIKSGFKVSRLKLPTRIIEIAFKPNSTNTIILTCDEGWQISFRIHSASTKVEPSLKFDIQLIGQPPTLYAYHLAW